MELEHVLVYGLVNVGGEEFIPNQAEIKVIFHGGMSWLFCSLKVKFIWSQFLKGVSQKISGFGTVSSFQYLLGLVVVSKNMGMWILRDHTWDNYRDRGWSVQRFAFLWEITLISTFQTKIESLVWGAFSDRIGLLPAVTGWVASCDGGPQCF